MANWQNRSALRASLGSMNRSGSKSLTSAANWVRYSVGSKLVIVLTPPRPARTAAHVVSRSSPTEVIMPAPVTTTLRRFKSNLPAET